MVDSPRTGQQHSLERCRAELTQHLEREQRFRRLFDSMLEGFCLAEIVFDDKGRPFDFRMIDVNETFGRITGLSPAQVRGRTARELVSQVEQYWIDSFACVVITGEPARFESYTAALDKWFDVFAYRTAPMQFACLFVDVTERRRDEQTRTEQFRLAEAVFINSLSSLAVLDRNYNFLRVNPAYARSARRGVDEFPGRNHFELYPSEAKLVFDDVVRTKTPFTAFSRAFEYPDQPERGVTYWDWTLVPILDAGGETEYLILSLVEVTARQLAEDALRASEKDNRQKAAELELIYCTAPVGLCVLDPQLRFLHVNGRLAEINGLPAEEHLGKTVREVVPHVADAVEPLLRQVLETGEPVLDVETNTETPVRPGVQRTWMSQYWPLKDDTGRVTGINVVAEEITERCRMEETRRHEREFRALAENSTDVISRFDRSLRRIYVNRAIETVFGRPSAEFIGKTPREMGLATWHAEAIEKGLIEVFTTGKPLSRSATVPTVKGDRHLDARLVPEFGPDGKVNTVLAITRDLTERKHAEDALRASEQKYRTLVENLYEGIWLIDAQGVTSFVNARLAELLGYQADEMLGKSLFDFIGEPSATAAKANLARGYGGTKADYEFEFQRKDGSPIQTRIATTPLFDDRGVYQGALAAVEDITDRKRTEASLRAYAQGQDFLVNTALALLQPMEHPALFAQVTERIYSLADGGLVLFNEYDPSNSRIIVRSLACTPEERVTVHRLLGRDPTRIILDFPESVRAQILPGELERLSGGLCELAFFQLPRELCDDLERALGVRAVFAMACSVEQDLLGTVAVLSRTGELRQKRLIETVVTEAALALKRKRAEDDLRKERDFFDTVFDTQGAIVAILDRHYRIARLNRAYHAITGFSSGSMIGHMFRDLIETSDALAVDRELDDLVNKNAAGEFESLVRVQDGESRHVSWRTTFRRNVDNDVDYVIATGIDVTERKQMEDHTRHLAEHDALTDLPNRRLLLELLSAALRTAQRGRHKVALLFLDLDHFKSINDTLGHQVGDALLKAVAARLSERVRRSDIVARLGGDEFTILLGELSRAERASEVAEEILQTFRHPFHLADQSLYITTSIGISVYPDDSDTADGLLRRADLSMYDAKEQGRNTYRFYNAVVDRRARERAQIENSLRVALMQGGLRIVYQPEIDLRTGRMSGIEALLRWQHPELGVLDPARFIPIAEESDLIIALDDWVLHTVCHQAKRWLDQGLDPICVGVNLSAKRFESADLVDAVRRHLSDSGLSPEHLELELTEHVVMRRTEETIHLMRELVALGVGIAIDDFGTGYSSLSYLKRLPINKLKIDQSFVRDIVTDADDRAIIRAVTALAHTLNKRVIAEGVETEAQRAFLAETGCDEAQGYFFAEPLPPDRFAESLAH